MKKEKLREMLYNEKCKALGINSVYTGLKISEKEYKKIWSDFYNNEHNKCK